MSDVAGIQDFRGIIPAECSLPANYASLAENVDLRRGCLQAWRKPEVIAGVSLCAARVHFDGCEWLHSSDPCAKFAEGGLCRDLYLSSPIMQPQQYVGCHGQTVPVGMCKPDPPAAEGGTETPDEWSYFGSYVITYSRGCIEGPPSRPSNTLCMSKVDPVMLTLPMPDLEWAADTVNIYRLMPLSAVNTNDYRHPELNTNNIEVLLQQDIEAEYFLVASLPIDTMRTVDVGSFKMKPRRMLVSDDDEPPPFGMCIVGETDAGSMVGYHGRHLYFSERNRYDAWPTKARVLMDFDIEQVVVCGDTVFAFTSRGPFVVQDDADCKDASCRRPRRAKCPLPLCAHHGYVLIEGGVVFASRDGLIRLLVDGTYQRITGSYFTPEEWRAIDPCSLHMARHEGMLFWTTSRGTWILDMDLDNAGTTRSNLTTSTVRPEQWIEGPGGELYLMHEGRAFQWNAGRERMTYRWRQSRQNLCDVTGIGAIKVVPESPDAVAFSDLMVELANAKLGTFYCGIVDSCDPKLVPNNRSTDTQLTLSGTETVRAVRYAASLRCLERRMENAA